MSLSENIKKYRLEKEYTQEQLASVLGVSAQAISKWENGKAKPKVQIIRKLAEFYRVSPEILLMKLEEKKAQKIFLRDYRD